MVNKPKNRLTIMDINSWERFKHDKGDFNGDVLEYANVKFLEDNKVLIDSRRLNKSLRYLQRKRNIV